MRLGTFYFNHPLFLAPMSGITDITFRRMAKEMGCSLVFTEMMSAQGLLRKRDSFLKIREEEHPLAVQLSGADPWILTGAAQMAESMGADIIDLNMGCPAKQVVETGAGAALMRFPEKVKAILKAVRRGIQIPLTIKIRSGWDIAHVNAVEISKIAEDGGVDAISIHPRTKVQGFHGRADWNLIRMVKDSVSIPVIGNGDVTTPSLARAMLKETGCDGVMIGRGSLGNPWIFSPEHLEVSHEGSLPPPSLQERENIIAHHFSLLCNHYGEKGALKEMRKHLAWYTKGLPFSASFRSTLPGIKEKESLVEALHSFFKVIQETNPCPSFELKENRSAIG